MQEAPSLLISGCTLPAFLKEIKSSIFFSSEKVKQLKKEKAKVHSVAGSHFMALVLQQIYLDDVTGSNPAFSLVAFTTCLLKPPLCYRAADHNQNSLCETEFTSGHTGLAS